MPTHPHDSDALPEADVASEPDQPAPEQAEQVAAAEQEPGPGAASGTGGGRDENAEAVEELRERWRRALADLDNLRKRHARELERERSAERARTAAALLPVIDNLELALGHAESDPGAIVEGVRAVRDQAVDTLERLGFERHAETGVPFDPGLHEVVGVVEDAQAEPGTVVQVQRPGYGGADQQLRPVAVTVATRG